MSVNPGDDPSVANQAVDPSGVLRTQIKDMQKLMETQVQLLQMQIEQNSLHDNTLAMDSQRQFVRQLKVPEGRYHMSLSEFRTFGKDCRDFKLLTKYSDQQTVMQMRLNMDADLKRAVDTNYSGEWDGFSVDDAIKAVGFIVKKISNPAVYRKEFDSMTQNSDEPIREFATRLKSCAIDCNFVCPYDETHSLIDYHIMNRVRSGLFDKSLQQEVLQKTDSLDSVTKILDYCNNFESAKRDKEKLALNNPSNELVLSNITADLTESDILAAISSYKKTKKSFEEPSGKLKCKSCGYEHVINKCPAKGKTCNRCHGKNHFQQQCWFNSKRKEKMDISSFVISTIEAIVGSNSLISYDLPRLKIYMSKDEKHLPSLVEVIADTGAQVTVASIQHMKRLGITVDELKKPPHNLQNASGTPLQVLGSRTVLIKHNDKVVEDEVYFARCVFNMYLSLNTCRNIGLIHTDFPHNNVEDINNDTSVNVIADNTYHPKLPNRPELMPFPATEEFVIQLEKWLLDKFASTTFNVTKDPLPPMNGKPHKIHISDKAVPYVAHSPIPVPHHWKEQVKKRIDKDVEMGILRKAPVGQPTEWCMRMVTVAKKDNTPRRTIDFQPINKFCVRETHHTPCPFDVVSNIPQKSYKSVLDAFNGYHQVPLDETSIPLTTFITEFGRYQYLRAPQGHVASGDAYTRRYDDVIVDVERKQKVVDDVLLYDESLEQAFYHVFDYLHLCGRNGVTINPKKFKFGRREVDFVGYCISWENYRPSNDMLSSIRDFPMPENPSITDIRSWFGLINQLAPFLATTPIMEPFRELLKVTKSVGKKVYWDDELQRLFEVSKSKICEIASTGLAYYDVKRETVVVTDWSKMGVGFVIMQKHCRCELTEETILKCCKGGWKLSFCNSRHLSPSEMNYAPIEGEALGITWALKKARAFLFGSPHFFIVVDHQPLLKIFGDKCLADITNPRLLKLKEKTLPYTFTLRHIKGIHNHANVLSRYPVGKPDDEDILSSDALKLSTLIIASAIVESDLSMSLDDLREVIKLDDVYKKLISIIENQSFAETVSLEDSDIREFYNIRKYLCVVDRIVMYSFEGKSPRVLIPTKLRRHIITSLHSANQGSTGMLSRARQTVYWPGMDRDINNHIEKCQQCRVSAPSQQKEPIILSTIPEYPFQKVVADLFEKDNHVYIAYADRLTGFLELGHFPSSVRSSVVIDILREFFQRWGVPEELSIDGGPNLVSQEMTSWLKSWKVKVRQSSAYYPQSNGRAETAVKSLKRLIDGNTGDRGSIKTDRIAQALLQHRNTPLRGMDKSPAQLALGRQLRDTLPLPTDRYKVDPKWAYQLRQRELQLSQANDDVKMKYDVNSKTLPDLKCGDAVLCQNVRSCKWDKSGIIVECGDYRQYNVRMDGSGRISVRNRKHLRKIVGEKPHTPIIVPDTTKNNHSSSNLDTIEGNKMLHNSVPVLNQSPEVVSDVMLNNPQQQLLPQSAIVPSSSPSEQLYSTESPERAVQLRRSTRVKQLPARFRV